MSEIMIGGRAVGHGRPCFIIAEIGTNHDRDIGKAKRLVDAAAEAGVDAVKFQIYEAGDIVNHGILPAEYGLGELYPGKTMYEVFDQHLRTPREWFPELADHARRAGVMPLATAHSGSGAAFIVEHDMVAIKIASMDLNNLPVLADIAEAATVPVIFSTGISELDEIDAAARLFRAAACPFAILHCVSNYPPRFPELHLRNIEILREAYEAPIGFSDHTLSTTTAAVAVALGACILEKHLTLNRNDPGPDHPFALEPTDLRLLVQEIRNIEAAYHPRSGFEGPSDRERQKSLLYRRSIVAARDIRRGERLDREAVKLTRPGSGIPPKHLELVLGRVAREDIPAERPLTWDAL